MLDVIANYGQRKQALALVGLTLYLVAMPVVAREIWIRPYRKLPRCGRPHLQWCAVA